MMQPPTTNCAVFRDVRWFVAAGEAELNKPFHDRKLGRVGLENK